jgi:hypothetical protein
MLREEGMLLICSSSEGAVHTQPSKPHPCSPYSFRAMADQVGLLTGA